MRALVFLSLHSFFELRSPSIRVTVSTAQCETGFYPVGCPQGCEPGAIPSAGALKDTEAERSPVTNSNPMTLWWQPQTQPGLSTSDCAAGSGSLEF